MSPCYIHPNFKGKMRAFYFFYNLCSKIVNYMTEKKKDFLYNGMSINIRKKNKII